MGGRKSARIEKIVGKSDYLKQDKKRFLDAIQSENPKKIVSSAVEFLTSSNEAINNISKATKLLDFINETKNRKETSYNERKEEVSKKWAEIKKKESLSTSSEIDKIFIESATKVIRRGKK